MLLLVGRIEHRVPIASKQASTQASKQASKRSAAGVPDRWEGGACRSRDGRPGRTSHELERREREAECDPGIATSQVYELFTAAESVTGTM